MGSPRALSNDYVAESASASASGLAKSASVFRFVSRAVCSPYSTLNLRRPNFSSRCRSDLEQSSAARHIRAVTSRLLHSLEDILLRTVRFIKLLSCLRSDIVILDTLIVLLTYLLTPPTSELWCTTGGFVLEPANAVLTLGRVSARRIDDFTCVLPG